MRSLLIRLAVVAIGTFMFMPAGAQDIGDFLRRTHWQCERGDQEACRIHRLYRSCEGGNPNSCREIESERYYEVWYEQRRQDFLRLIGSQCELGDQEACRIRYLYHECDRGAVYACEEIQRERYHHRWQNRDRDQSFEPDRYPPPMPSAPVIIQPEIYRYQPWQAPVIVRPEHEHHHDWPRHEPATIPPDQQRHHREGPQHQAPAAIRHQAPPVPAAPHAPPPASAVVQPETHHHKGPQQVPAVAQPPVQHQQAPPVIHTAPPVPAVTHQAPPVIHTAPPAPAVTHQAPPVIHTAPPAQAHGTTPPKKDCPPGSGIPCK